MVEENIAFKSILFFQTCVGMVAVMGLSYSTTHLDANGTSENEAFV